MSLIGQMCLAVYFINCSSIPTKLQAMNKERRKSQQATHCFCKPHLFYCYINFTIDYSSWFSPKTHCSSSSRVWPRSDHSPTTHEPLGLKAHWHFDRCRTRGDVFTRLVCNCDIHTHPNKPHQGGKRTPVGEAGVKAPLDNRSVWTSVSW